MKRLAVCACVAVLFLSLPVSSQGPPGPGAARTELVDGREAVAGEALVRFRDLPAAGVSAAVEQADGDRIEEVGRGGRDGFRLIHSRRFDASTLVQILSRHPDVVFASPNFIVRAVVTPNDPSFPSLWGLLNTGQPIGGVTGTLGADIDAPQAWNLTTGSRANVIGVVDTGIDYTHPDLVANVWSAPAAFTVNIAGHAINCLAGSHGFNALTNLCDPKDDHDHGTHVSGTIGASGNNGLGVAGVNWVASIMGLKFLDSTGSGTTVGAINAIEFAIQAKHAFAAVGGANVRVLSNSWGGGGFSQPLLDEINRANGEDMLFAAAAGNSGTNNDTSPFYPSGYNAPNVVSVAATTNQDARASFSNYGATTVDLGAPGHYILSTVRNNAYAYFSGTSMATPHVAGAAALVLSRCSLSTSALKDLLLATVDQIPSMALTVTGGRLNVARAVNGCTPPPPNMPPSVTLSEPVDGATFTAGEPINVKADASDTDGTIDHVEFYSGGSLVGTDDSYPYGMTLSNVAPGSYILTAKAFDNLTLFKVSDQVHITVNSPSGSSSFSDDFTRPNSTIVGNGWLEVQGDLQVKGNELTNSSTSGYEIGLAPLSGAVASAGADFAFTQHQGTPRFGIVLRYQNAQNYYLLYRQSGGSSLLRISRFVNGVETVLKSATLANPAKDVFFRIDGSANGNTLTLKLNGAVKLTVTDATFGTGGVGLLMGSTLSHVHRADNFVASTP